MTRACEKLWKRITSFACRLGDQSFHGRGGRISSTFPSFSGFEHLIVFRYETTGYVGIGLGRTTHLDPIGQQDLAARPAPSSRFPRSDLRLVHLGKVEHHWAFGKVQGSFHLLDDTGLKNRQSRVGGDVRT